MDRIDISKGDPQKYENLDTIKDEINKLNYLKKHSVQLQFNFDVLSNFQIIRNIFDQSMKKYSFKLLSISLDKFTVYKEDPNDDKIYYSFAMCFTFKGDLKILKEYFIQILNEKQKYGNKFYIKLIDFYTIIKSHEKIWQYDFVKNRILEISNFLQDEYTISEIFSNMITKKTTHIDVILKNLNKAQQKIEVICFELSDVRMMTALELCLLNEINSEFLLNKDFINQEDEKAQKFVYLIEIYKEKIKVGFLEKRVIHDKLLIIDNQIYYGTSNFTYSGFTMNNK
ncbi:hypothetical protein ABPG74_005059 [Tetrahymena malaccensis]